MNYRSPFTNWSRTASIWSKAERKIAHEQDDGKYFFSREIVPYAQHKICQGSPEVLKILMTRQMYAYMSFTEQLEHEVVNEITYKISADRMAIELPLAMRRDARKIYVDESHHAKFSADLVDDVESTTGISQCDLPRPKFLRLLDNLTEGFTNAEVLAGRACLATVSETLITGSLLKIPKDASVVSAVRELVADHAGDERLHHAYFKSFFPEYWRQLPKSLQGRLGKLLPAYIKGFVAPDLEIAASILRNSGLSESDTQTIIDDSYTPERMTDFSAAHATLRLFAEVGIFQDAEFADAFALEGITPP